MRLKRAAVPDYFDVLLFIVLFAWISFFSQPVQDRYEIFGRAFLAIFLLILTLRQRKLFSLQDWPFWIFLLGIFPGIIKATDPGVALKTYLYLSLNGFFVFYIGKMLVGSGKNMNSLSIVICLCSIMVSLVGFFEAVYGFNPIYKYFIANPYYNRYISDVVRPMATLFNPAPLATYCLFTWPFGILLSKQAGPKIRLLGYVTIVLNVACLIMTFSRGTFLGLILMSFCYLLLSKRYKDMLIFGIVMLIILIILEFLPYPFCRFSFKGIGIYGTGIFSDYRLLRAKMSWEMFKSHPLFGVGLNHFRVLFDNFCPFKYMLQYIDYEVKIADNMHLTLLAETGISGLIGFMVFTTSLIFKGFKKYEIIRDENKRNFLLVSICVLMGILCSMAGYELFYWYTPYILFCLICGFIRGATD